MFNSRLVWRVLQHVLECSRELGAAQWQVYEITSYAEILECRKELRDAFNLVATDGSDYAFKWGDHDHYQFGALHGSADRFGLNPVSLLRIDHKCGSTSAEQVTPW